MSFLFFQRGDYVLVTEKLDEDTIKVSFNYYKPYITRIKKIPGSHYDGKLKAWLFPIGFFVFFEDEFKGEIIYKTPRWIILNEPMPDLKSMYKINHNIHLPKLKLNLFDYQEFGSKYLIDILYKSRFAICADDVGLGSCLQVNQ